MPVLIGLAAVLLLGILLVLGVRTARFRPEPIEAPPADEIPLDGAAAVEHLRQMIRCRTVSAPEERDEAEFERFRDLLPRCYPQVFSRCRVERVDSTGLLIRWEGKRHEAPAVFLSHYDVVPADPEAWEKPPFDAVLEDGVLWGRGALDMKNQLCCTLEAMEYLLKQDFRPERNIYMALSGEEEIMGPTAETIRDLFRQRGIAPVFVLDEGGDIIDGFFPGTDQTCAMVGVGEKGVANLHFVAKSAGGHASVPTKDNPLLRLCQAVTRLRSFPQRSCPALERMVDVMGRYCDSKTRLLLANRDVLRPLYYRWLRRQGGMLEASSRTTVALTRARGSSVGNVIPTEAELFANVRMLWGDTTESVIRRLRKEMRDPGIEIQKSVCADPRPDSELTEGWDALRSAIRATWPEAVVTPYLMVATTDARHWRDICPNVYRFSAKTVTGEEKATVHGNNERIRVENTLRGAQFFVRLMRQC